MKNKVFAVLSLVVVFCMVFTGNVFAAAPAATDVDCTKEGTFCVGLVTDVGKIDDKSFNQSAYEGLKQAEKDLGATIKYIETTDSKDYAKNISTFAENGYKVIVTVGFALGEATIAAAKQYPDIKFIGVDQSQSETIPNLTGVIFEEDKSGYLAGVLAGLMTKSNKLGGIFGTDAVPAVWRFGEGYRAGILSVNPKAEINIVYHSDVGFDKTFTDPEWGKTTAISMIDKGVDVIFGAGGKTGNGALIGVAGKSTTAKPVYAIGVDTDQYLTVPEAQKVLLSSAMKSITPGVFDTIKSAKDGKFKGGNFIAPVALAPFHDLESAVPADVKTKLAEVDKGLKDGSIKTNVSAAKPE
ncbi:MAG: BMP family ABC transporter substrate-binding protein [Leptolinea sp.]|jgi:basic membrane protein A|nr:BMP family ABC transporter substrate-binding protein [Leptolinea sp.]